MNTATAATAATFILTDVTTGQSWDYDSERQLKTVATLHARSNPTHALSVTINGVTHVIRREIAEAGA